jgi:hypothetical protein
LLLNEETARVSWTPPNVTDTTLLLFALTPTTRRRLFPVPALKPESAIWKGGSETVPDVADIPLRAMGGARVVALASFDGGEAPAGLEAVTK